MAVWKMRDWCVAQKQMECVLLVRSCVIQASSSLDRAKYVLHSYTLSKRLELLHEPSASKY